MNDIPPSPQELLLAANAVVKHPSVLPRIDAQDRDHVRAARSAGRAAFVAGTAVQLRAIVVLVHHVVVVADHAAAVVVEAALRVHVGALAAPVCLRVRTAGLVGCQDAERVAVHAVRIALAHEPDKARAKHGVGRVEHVALEGLEAAKGGHQLLVQVFGHVLVWVLAAVRGDAFKVKVVVVRHGGVVEDGGGFCLARRDDCDFFDGLVFESLACDK